MEPNNNENKQFPTQDFYLACVLKSYGIQLQAIIHNTSGRATFIFNDKDVNIESLIQKHWNNELKVNSLELVEAINQLKTRIHSGI